MIVLTKESTQHENLQDPGARIFDRGSLMENLAQNFGESSNKLTWLVPVTLGDLPGDGHYFKFYYTG